MDQPRVAQPHALRFIYWCSFPYSLWAFLYLERGGVKVTRWHERSLYRHFQHKKCKLSLSPWEINLEYFCSLFLSLSLSSLLFTLHRKITIGFYWTSCRSSPLTMTIWTVFLDAFRSLFFNCRHLSRPQHLIFQHIVIHQNLFCYWDNLSFFVYQKWDLNKIRNLWQAKAWFLNIII